MPVGVAGQVLDGDERRLSYKGRVASRDIVQFVPMRDFVSKDPTGRMVVVRRTPFPLTHTRTHMQCTPTVRRRTRAGSQPSHCASA